MGGTALGVKPPMGGHPPWGVQPFLCLTLPPSFPRQRPAAFLPRKVGKALLPGRSTSGSCAYPESGTYNVARFRTREAAEAPPKKDCQNFNHFGGQDPGWDCFAEL